VGPTCRPLDQRLHTRALSLNYGPRWSDSSLPLFNGLTRAWWGRAHAPASLVPFPLALVSNLATDPAHGALLAEICVRLGGAHRAGPNPSLPCAIPHPEHRLGRISSNTARSEPWLPWLHPSPLPRQYRRLHNRLNKPQAQPGEWTWPDLRKLRGNAAD
jgi:hypothetical protein